MSVDNERVCYTKDGLIVFTLFVTNSSNEMTTKDVKDYFQTFGEITFVEFKGKYYRGFCAYVTFERAEDAAKALCQPNHCSFSKDIHVFEAGIWHQPESAFEFSSYLLDLNEDCMLHIMTYLDSATKLRLSFTCQRFREHYETLLELGEILNYNDFISNVELPEATEFLSRSGQHIKRLLCEYPVQNYVTYLELLPTYCNNLEDIKFRMFYNIPFKSYSRIFRANENLKKIDLSCGRRLITDSVCAEISRLKQLENLNLSGNYITGEHLDKIESLVELTLNGTQIQPKPFIQLCNKLQLKSLNIANCRYLTKEAYQAIVDTQTQLQRIVVSEHARERRGRRRETVAQIKNLKHIEIYYDYNNDDNSNLYAELVTHKRDSLESLTLHGCETSETTRNLILQFRNIRKLSLLLLYVDPNFLLKIAQNYTELREFICPGSDDLKENVLIDFMQFGKNLEKMNVSKWKLSDSVYEKLVAVLNERTVKPMQPIELCVHGAGISKDILNTEIYRQNRNLLKLSFDGRDAIGPRRLNIVSKPIE